VHYSGSCVQYNFTTESKTKNYEFGRNSNCIKNYISEFTEIRVRAFGLKNTNCRAGQIFPSQCVFFLYMSKERVISHDAVRYLLHVSRSVRERISLPATNMEHLCNSGAKYLYMNELSNLQSMSHRGMTI
jgi:hypothetical protein